MKTKITKRIGLIVAVIGFMVLQSGCGSVKMTQSGFLSDYSQLRSKTDSSMVFVDETALAKYDSFIVEPVQTHFIYEAESGQKLSPEKVIDMRNYMHKKFIESVQNAGKKVVYQPGVGVARIRSALTDMKQTDLINVVPVASVIGTGIGGASVEIEILDSRSNKQVAAAIESKEGSRIPFTNLNDWAAAKKVMNNWGKRLQKRLE